MVIDDYLEMLDDLLDKAPTVPFSGKKVIVESDKIRDVLNEIRLNLPSEIQQAKHIVKDRQNIVSDANKEAEMIVRKSEDRAKNIVSNDEIMKQAKQNATELLNQAQSKAKDIRSATNQYIDNILNQTEQLLTTSLVDVKKTKQAIRMTSKNPSNDN